MPRTKTAAELDEDLKRALATRHYVRRQWATAWFRPDWNAWTIGYHTEGKTGGADAYTTAPSEADAHRIANAFNAEQEQYALAREAAVKKAQHARAKLTPSLTAAQRKALATLIAVGGTVTRRRDFAFYANGAKVAMNLTAIKSLIKLGLVTKALSAAYVESYTAIDGARLQLDQ